MRPNRKTGPGLAAQRLETYARILERRGERPVIVEAIRIILDQRSRMLTEKSGPPRDFSRPSPTGQGEK